MFTISAPNCIYSMYILRTGTILDLIKIYYTEVVLEQNVGCSRKHVKFAF